VVLLCHIVDSGVFVVCRQVVLHLLIWIDCWLVCLASVSLRMAVVDVCRHRCDGGGPTVLLVLDAAVDCCFVAVRRYIVVCCLRPTALLAVVVRLQQLSP
jgi:hypothetical protein